MTSFIVYNNTGVILKTGHCPDNMLAIQARTGENVMTGVADDASQYINTGTGEITDKQVMAAAIDKTTLSADRADFVTITGLPTTDLNGNPISTYVKVSGVIYEVADGVAEISTDSPGSLEIICQADTYLDKVFTVEAV